MSTFYLRTSRSRGRPKLNPPRSFKSGPSHSLDILNIVESQNLLSKSEVSTIKTFQMLKHKSVKALAAPHLSKMNLTELGSLFYSGETREHTVHSKLADDYDQITQKILNRYFSFLGCITKFQKSNHIKLLSFLEGNEIPLFIQNILLNIQSKTDRDKLEALKVLLKQLKTIAY